MDKTLTVNQKRANKQPKNKKKQPLKVVYITNPIRFKATASEFRALVQELTGQDADIPEPSRFAAADGVGVGVGQEELATAAKVAAAGNAHALEEVAKIGHAGDDETLQKGSDLSAFGSYDDDDDNAFFSPLMMENFRAGLAATNMWHEDANLDVSKSPDAM